MTRRSQKPLTKIDERSSKNSLAADSNATKRQKLESGYLRKVQGKYSFIFFVFYVFTCVLVGSSFDVCISSVILQAVDLLHFGLNFKSESVLHVFREGFKLSLITNFFLVKEPELA